MNNESDWLKRAQKERRSDLEGGDQEAIALIEQANIIVSRLTTSMYGQVIDQLDADRVIEYISCEYVNNENYLNPKNPYEKAIIRLVVAILQERGFVSEEEGDYVIDTIEGDYRGTVSVNNLFLKPNNSISVSYEEVQYTLRIDCLDGESAEVTLEICKLPEFEYDPVELIEIKTAVIGMGTEISTGEGFPLFKIVSIEREFAQVKLLASIEG